MTTCSVIKFSMTPCSVIKFSMASLRSKENQ